MIKAIFVQQSGLFSIIILNPTHPDFVHPLCFDADFEGYFSKEGNNQDHQGSCETIVV